MSPKAVGLQAQRLRLATVGCGLLVVACTSSAVQPGPVEPGTGQLAFRLTWTGLADLDLYAQSPLGERVNFLHRDVKSGGALDIDCNVAEFRCIDPMENIFWPRGAAPPGSYKYWVVIANPAGLERSDTYRLRVLLRGRIVVDHGGSIADLPERPLTGWVRID